MADVAHPTGSGAAGHHGGADTSRRDFLTLTAAAVGGIGAAAALWPFIDSMNPAQATRWPCPPPRSISRRSRSASASPSSGAASRSSSTTAPPEEIKEAEQVDVAELRDPQTDEPSASKKPEWLVLVGICTHLGCIPLGQKPTDDRGEFGGWFCPCHGSHYDTSGRIRKGPAPQNLAVPPYAFTGDTQIKIG